MFTNISNIFNPINENHIVIGGGDLNARIGNINRKNFKGHYRKTPDTVVNTHGKSLLKICKNSDIYVINNLTYKSNHFDGNLTCHKGNKSSQNDICLTNNYGLDYLESFKIHIILRIMHRYR